jgi:hypothetical protein
MMHAQLVRTWQPSANDATLPFVNVQTLRQLSSF